MTYVTNSTTLVRKARWIAGLGALLLAATPAFAQDAAPAAAAGDAAPAAAADAGKAPLVNWVKICEKVQIPDPAAKDPKTAKPVDHGFCVTQQERLDGNSGTILVAVAVREDDGQDKKGLLITVPTSVIIPAGVHIFFDDEKDEKKVIGLPFQACLPSGCTAQAEATPDVLAQMGKAKVMTVVGVNIQGQQVPLRIQMNGFATVMGGKPVDTAAYVNARKKMILAIQERIIAKQQAARIAAGEAIKGVKEDQAAKDAGAAAPADGAAPPDPTAKTGN